MLGFDTKILFPLHTVYSSELDSAILLKLLLLFERIRAPGEKRI